MTETHITHHSGEDYPVVCPDSNGFHRLPSASRYMAVLPGFTAYEIERWKRCADLEGVDLPTWCARQLRTGANHRLREVEGDRP